MTTATLGTEQTAHLDAVRAAEFPWTLSGDVSFLNHASTGPLPERTVQAMAHWSELRHTPWKIAFDYQFGVLEKARSLGARLIGAQPNEVALMVNTTYGLNFAARALPLEPGDVVLSSDREFPANVYPWMAIEKTRGVTFRQLECRNRLADEDALVAALDDRQVKLLTVSWVSFETGQRLNLERLGARCRERGVFFVVDAIQGVGAAPIDVRAANIDILACGAQKWLLSPWGSAFLYVRKELIPTLEPQDVGWMSVKPSADFTKIIDYDLDYFDDARRFEVITLPVQDIAGMNASLELFFDVGLERVHQLVRERATQIVDWAKPRQDVTLLTPEDPSRRAGIVSVIVPDADAASRALWDHGVAHSLREGAIRLSPHFYTPEESLARALELL